MLNRVALPCPTWASSSRFGALMQVWRPSVDLAIGYGPASYAIARLPQPAIHSPRTAPHFDDSFDDSAVGCVRTTLNDSGRQARIFQARRTLVDTSGRAVWSSTLPHLHPATNAELTNAELRVRVSSSDPASFACVGAEVGVSAGQRRRSASGLPCTRPAASDVARNSAHDAASVTDARMVLRSLA